MSHNSFYTRDLSKDPYSATSVFIKILPQIKSIKQITTNEDERIFRAKDLIIASLKHAQERSPKSISSSYIESYAHRIDSCIDLNDIIDMVSRSINRGKNYSG